MSEKTEWRIVCAGNHSGRKHIFAKQSRQAAMKAIEVWDGARNDFTKKYCVPGEIQSRVLTSWKKDDETVQQNG